MYNEERKKGSLLKDFILKLILIIVFVLLLIWLVPWPDMSSLNPLKDQIFNANLQTMKEAGISYFTTERLPEEVGDKTTLTLQKMLDLKLLVPFTDKNGDSCDVTASYVSLEKKETEYLMKVNLKCGEEEDYILVHLGCYSYCTTDICEAKPGNTEPSTTTPKPTNKPTPSQTQLPSPTPTSTASPKPTTSPTPSNSPTPTASPKEDKLCEYKKDFNAQYSAWVDGPEEMKKTGQTLVFGMNADQTQEVVDLGIRRIAVGTKAAVYERVYVEQMQYVKYKTLTYKLCNKYSYVADVTTVYRVVRDWQWTDEYAYGYIEDIPKNTLSEEWVFQTVDYDHCKENCTSHPYGIYRKRTRVIAVDNEYSNVTASCDDIVEKSVDVYISVPVGNTYTVEKTPAQTLYGNVQFYRVRTRTLLKQAYTDYQWVDCDDKSLANQGWTYTGKTKNK